MAATSSATSSADGERRPCLPPPRVRRDGVGAGKADHPAGHAEPGTHAEGAEAALHGDGKQVACRDPEQGEAQGDHGAPPALEAPAVALGPQRQQPEAEREHEQVEPVPARPGEVDGTRVPKVETRPGHDRADGEQGSGEDGEDGTGWRARASQALPGRGKRGPDRPADHARTASLSPNNPVGRNTSTRISTTYA